MERVGQLFHVATLAGRRIRTPGGGDIACVSPREQRARAEECNGHGEGLCGQARLRNAHCVRNIGRKYGTRGG